jgi:eukaryotic-like serine/threonine-protein kinase
MAMATGTRLGPYEILTPLGAGGMGEVYRAKDTRLDRIVAIKILSSHLSSNVDLKARFEREARTVSSLSHPHICALYDIGEQDGVSFLVMEFLEGQTLAERLTKGALPMEQVLRYGIQIADALDRAHKAGIIHRDLKPGNIMLTKSGVKLLDFGLAKLQNTASQPIVGVSALATEQHSLTAEGTILGTLQYMSPEQLEGRDTDARTDIFSFGAVLYEMATARKAFAGKSQASLIAAILQTDPPSVSSSQPLSPPAFDRLVQQCLAKDPEDRWQNAHDLMAQLKWVLEGGSDSGIATPVAARRRSREHVRWSLLGAFIGALLTLLGAWFIFGRPQPDPHIGTHLILPIPETDQLSFNQDRPFFAISPDGQSIVYNAIRNNALQLFLRRLDSPEPVALAGTENALAPFFSPDGQWLAFYQDSKIKKVPVSGGSSIVITEADYFVGGSWSKDQGIVAVPDWAGGNQLFSFPVAGGEGKELARADQQKKERVLLWPEVLPNGKGVLLAMWSGGTLMDTSIVVQPLPKGERKTLIKKGSFPKYVDTGHILFAQETSIFAVPFDKEKLEITGSAVPVLEGVAISGDSAHSAYSISRNGTLAYVPGKVMTQDRTLVSLDRSGKETIFTDLVRPFFDPDISPDGKRIAFILRGQTYDVWMLDLNRDILTRITFYGDELGPVWTPDGKRVIYSSSQKGKHGLYWKSVDGSQPEEALLTTKDFNQYPGSCTPDGKFLTFRQVNSLNTTSDIGILSLQGEHKASMLINSEFYEEGGMISPNGRLIAYSSNESGRKEVYVQTFPDGRGKTQVSTHGGFYPKWARNGGELFYWQDHHKFVTVSIQTEPSLSVSKPSLVFEGEYESIDVFSDGRFLAVKPVKPSAPIQLHVIIGWLDQLKQKMKN